MPDYKYSLGIDIGGTNTVFGLVASDGQIIKKDSILTKSSKVPELLFENIFNKIKIWEAELELPDIIKDIGVGVPNGNYFTGMVVSPPNLGMGWDELNLVSLIKSYKNIPVAITNDANAAALGEKYYGVAKSMNDVVVITLGTGLGSGILVNNNILYGHDGFAGELGHLVIEPKGRDCGCGRKGCLEMYVSAKGINYTIREYIKNYPENSFLQKLGNKNIDVKILDRAFDNDEKIVIDIYKYTGQMLGLGLAQIAKILSPEAFVFYGGLSNAKHRILDFAKDSMNANRSKYQKNKIKILLSELSEGEAGILGASCLHMLNQ
ncbi:MAG: glucokinase [Candidatus Marinimicrobia bacterium]|nr:glucokinase [Candidatus Neomarinimicrobiota bacterium]